MVFFHNRKKIEVFEHFWELWPNVRRGAMLLLLVPKKGISVKLSSVCLSQIGRVAYERT